MLNEIRSRQDTLRYGKQQPYYRLNQLKLIIAKGVMRQYGKIRQSIVSFIMLIYIIIYIIYIYLYRVVSKLQERQALEPSKQPGTITNNQQPSKNRASSALKYQQGKHQQQFLYYLTSPPKTEPCCIIKTVFNQSLAMLKHQAKAIRTTIDSIYSYIMRPMPSRIAPSQHHSSRNDPACTHATALFDHRTLFFSQANAHKGVYILTLWDKVAPSVV